MAITGTTCGDIFVRAEKKKRGRPKKISPTSILSPTSIFNDGEKKFILEHARRGEIANIIFRLSFDKIYYSDFQHIDYGKFGSKYLKFRPINLTKNNEKFAVNKLKIKRELIKALEESEEMDVDDEGVLTLYTYERESDELILARYEKGGRLYLKEEFRRFRNKLKQEKRKVLFEKIKKPRKRIVSQHHLNALNEIRRNEFNNEFNAAQRQENEVQPPLFQRRQQWLDDLHGLLDDNEQYPF